MKPEQLRSSAAGLRDHGHEYHGAACDMEEAADRIASLEAEVTTLRVQLTAAQSLRLGRAPTGDDIRRHVAALGQEVQMLAGQYEADPVTWERFILEVDVDGTVLVDGVEGFDERDFTDAIFLDTNGQPCPCGGWTE